MTSPLRRPGLLVALVATLVVAACGSSTPTPSPSTAVPSAVPTPAPTEPASPGGAPTSTPGSSPAAIACDDQPPGSPGVEDPATAAVYDTIEQQIEDLRGIRATAKIERNVFDRPALCAYLRNRFQEKNPPELVRSTEALYKELGLIPEDASLEQLYLELLTSQLGGLYDQDTKKMYLVSSAAAPGPIERFSYSHEYTHALADQAFDLKALLGDATDQTDRGYAHLAIAEGDATVAMLIWARDNLSTTELLQAASAADPASQAVLNGMPAILKDPLFFPYSGGQKVVLDAISSGGGYGAVDELYRNPPDSTEQILHADKLAAREAPVKVAFPEDFASRLGDGWKVSTEDTFGEMLLEIILRDHGATGTADAAAGWGGDRVALVEGPAGEKAIVLDTAWDTEADADEFATALEATKAELDAAGKSAQILRPDPSRVVLVSAESPDTLGRVANVLGLAG